MAKAQTIDRQTFLAYVRQSGLLTEAELTAALPQLPETDRGRVLARSMVDQGLLTRFQAERLLVGRTAGFLLGQYRILDQLGRGGMGRVFKAEHVTMKRVVAIKVLTPELMQTERAQQLFAREVQVAASLAHPNIVTAFDANVVDGRYFLVMEYVDGPNLEQLVRNQGPLPLGLACDYISQAANALQCAQQLGMVHRDIKPANLLLQRRGFSESSPGLIKISDFGLARLQTPGSDPTAGEGVGTILIKENTVMGTPDYLSPEQARNLHNTDIRSDIYSLGCTFYYLLTGQVPFPGGQPIEKLLRHTTEKPAPLIQFRGDVPEAVQQILNRMLAKRPADRFQTSAEIIAAMEPYAVSGPTPWAPSSPLPGLPEKPTDDEEGPEASNELSALANTMPAGKTPTPLAIVPDNRRRGRTRTGRKWTLPGSREWIYLGAGLLGLVLGLAALLWLWRG